MATKDLESNLKTKLETSLKDALGRDPLDEKTKAAIQKLGTDIGGEVRKYVKGITVTLRLANAEETAKGLGLVVGTIRIVAVLENT